MRPRVAWTRFEILDRLDRFKQSPADRLKPDWGETANRVSLAHLGVFDRTESNSPPTDEDRTGTRIDGVML
jgi:hypothetical protein